MAEENMLKSITDSAGLNAENIQNVKEMGKDLIDKISEKVEEGSEEFNKVKNEMTEIASGIINSSEKLEHKIEDEISEMVEESKGKLNDTANDISYNFSGVISDLTKFSGEIQNKASEYSGNIKNGVDRITDDIRKTISEKVSENEVTGNLSGAASAASDELDKLSEENVGDRLEKTVGKINQCEENINFGDFAKGVEFINGINERTVIEVEEETDQMNESIKETFGTFQKLNKKVANVEEIVGEKLQNFKEGIDEEFNKINEKTENVDKEKEIAGLSDISVKANDDNAKKEKNSTVSEEIDVMEKITLLGEGEDIPEQRGTPSALDDHETKKAEGMRSDIVNDKADEMDKLLDEAFNIDKKLKEPETTDAVRNQKIC